MSPDDKHGDIAPGTRIGGYVVVNKVDQGFMTTVYRATRESDGRTVALKQLRPHIVLDQQLIERFTNGLEILKGLSHPHVAKVFDYFQEGGHHFEVEEFLPLGSLLGYLENNRGPAPEKMALTWCYQALQGLDWLHQNGVVHRDIKPNNLMLDAAGQVKVTDFGIAKVMGARRMTVTGDQLGTPEYMSPEQVLDAANVNHLTDVYSMGVVLFELLTGKLPFGSNTTNDFETRRAVVQDPVPRPRNLNPAISRRLQRIVMRAMRKQPAKRFGGGSEFATAISQYLESLERPRPKPPVAAVLSAVGGLLILAVGFLWGRSTKPITVVEPPPLVLKSPGGTSVVLEPGLHGDTVEVVSKSNSVVTIDLARSRILVQGIPAMSVEKLPSDPRVNDACHQFLKTKEELDRARTANREASAQLVKAIDALNKATPAQQGAAQVFYNAALKTRTLAEQAERAAREAFIKAAETWAGMPPGNPCPTSPP